jgi:hypothetical protein
MATNPRIGQVDHLLDDIQLGRVELHGRVQKVRADVLRIRHMAREAYEELMDLERELAGPDEQYPGGEMFQKVSDLRSHRAIRKAQPWDGKPRRKGDRHGGQRHLEVAAA